jgi:hypothetical protein
MVSKRLNLETKWSGRLQEKKKKKKKKERKERRKRKKKEHYKFKGNI